MRECTASRMIRAILAVMVLATWTITSKAAAATPGPPCIACGYINMASTIRPWLRTRRKRSQRAYLRAASVRRPRTPIPRCRRLLTSCYSRNHKGHLCEIGGSGAACPSNCIRPYYKRH